MGQKEQQGSGTAGPTHPTRRKIPRACCTNVQWTRLREGRFDLSHHRKHSLVLCPGVNSAFGERENGHRGVGILQILRVCTRNGMGQQETCAQKYLPLLHTSGRATKNTSERPQNGTETAKTAGEVRFLLLLVKS